MGPMSGTGKGYVFLTCENNRKAHTAFGYEPSVS